MADDARISLASLFDLFGRLEGEIGNTMQSWRATKAVLQWAEAQGFLTEGRQHQDHLSRVEGGPADIKIDIPAGPQAAPEGEAAGCLNDKAAPSDTAKAPTGAEGEAPAPEDAPAPPVAGGGAPQAAPQPEKRQLPPLWTEDEGRIAVFMAAEGHKAEAIARHLGRPVQGTIFRLRNKLADKIAAARLEGTSGARGPDPLPDAPPAADLPPAALVAIAPIAPAPAFDPVPPAWWREAQNNLNALGYRRPFTATFDLQLVEELQRGTRLDVLAADTMISALDLKNRWRALLSCVGTSEGTKPTLEEQQRLLQILRHRAGELVKAAE